MRQGKQTQSGTDGAMAEYYLIADTIGGVPNLRGKDNLYQTIAIVVCWLLARQLVPQSLANRGSARSLARSSRSSSACSYPGRS